MPLAPLQLLWETGSAPALDLPQELQHLYGGPLRLPDSCVYANFVASLDGVVAIPGLAQSNKQISGGSAADRFVMGLLRACADVVLIGSGTLRGSPRAQWMPESAYPPGEEAFRELRRRRGQCARPEVAVMTATGGLDTAHPALAAGALVLTTHQGARALEGQLPAASTVLVVDSGTELDPRSALAVLHRRGHRSILSEAGPRVFGSLLAAGLVDELFLTSSPVVAGRPPGGGPLGLVEGVELLPGKPVDGRLLSIRRHEQHLFLRYALSAAPAD